MNKDNHTTIVIANQSLAKLEAAKQSLAECKTLPDIVTIRDQAVAAESYAKAAKLSAESVAYAVGIKLLAERRAGEVLAKLEKGNRTGRISSSQPLEVQTPYRKTVEQAHISKDQSARWQKLAKLNDKEMEDKIQSVKRRIIRPVNGETKTVIDEPATLQSDIKFGVYRVFEESNKQINKFKALPEKKRFKKKLLQFLNERLVPDYVYVCAIPPLPPEKGKK